MVRAVAGNITDIGCRRPENQDYFGDFEPDDALRELGRLVIVADGVGGHKGGRLASRLAVDVVAESYYRPIPGTARQNEGDPDIGERLRIAFQEANRRIFRKALDDRSLKGMASTCTALVLQRGWAHGAHVGDSRAYVLRQGALRQLTHDHSAVQERIDQGLLKESERREHFERNLITRSLGFQPDVQPDILTPLALERDDRLLLCSDGLHGTVSDQEIASLLDTPDPMEACERLVAAANRRGGPDNVTVQVLRIDDPRADNI
jgi:serine/threonine protein phosphatase PrpC